MRIVNSLKWLRKKFDCNINWCNAKCCKFLFICIYADIIISTNLSRSLSELNWKSYIKCSKNCFFAVLFFIINLWIDQWIINVKRVGIIHTSFIIYLITYWFPTKFAKQNFVGNISDKWNIEFNCVNWFHFKTILRNRQTFSTIINNNLECSCKEVWKCWFYFFKLPIQSNICKSQWANKFVNCLFAVEHQKIKSQRFWINLIGIINFHIMCFKFNISVDKH